MSDVFSTELVAAELASVLGRLARSASKRSPLPVLSCVRLRVSEAGAGLVAATTDLDRWHEAPVSVSSIEGESGAGCCVSLALLSRALGQCGDATVKLALSDEDSLSLRSNGSKISVKVFPLSDWPDGLKGLASVEWESFEAQALANAMQEVSFAASNDPTRWTINGVHFAESGEVVATNGRMMAWVPGEVPASWSGKILPTDSVAMMAEALGREGGCEVAMTDGGFVCRRGEELCFAKAIEGKYPSFKQVIPEYADDALNVVVGEASMRAALDWALLMAGNREKANWDVGKFSFEQGEMRIEKQSPDIGEAANVVQVEREGSDGVRTGSFSLSQLRDFSARFAEDGKVRIALDPGGGEELKSPLMIRRPSDGASGLSMPFRIG